MAVHIWFRCFLVTVLGMISVQARAVADKNFLFAVPLASVGGEAVLKGEFNLSGMGGLGLELVRFQRDDFGKKEKEERNGDSLLVDGLEVAVSYISYGDPKRMSGGYWMLGAGYRQMQTDWLREELSQDNNEVKHVLRSKGATVRGRIGYRYVGKSVPFMAGIYLGLRHFQNKMKETELAETNVLDVPIEKTEAASLERRFTSSLEPGLEFGMAF